MRQKDNQVLVIVMCLQLRDDSSKARSVEEFPDTDDR